MRVSFYAQPSHIPPIAPSPVQVAPPAPAQFLPFSAEAFQQARTRDVPVLTQHAGNNALVAVTACHLDVCELHDGRRRV